MKNLQKLLLRVGACDPQAKHYGPLSFSAAWKSAYKYGQLNYVRKLAVFLDVVDSKGAESMGRAWWSTLGDGGLKRWIARHPQFKNQLRRAIQNYKGGC